MSWDDKTRWTFDKAEAMENVKRLAGIQGEGSLAQYSCVTRGAKLYCSSNTSFPVQKRMQVRTKGVFYGYYIEKVLGHYQG